MSIEFARSGWKDGWYVVPYEVVWRDLDPFGHVNNAVYFSWFEWGRTRYWLDLLGTNRPTDINFIVARAECNFRRQVGLAEQIEIAVRIDGIRTSSFDFVYEIRQKDGAELVADGKVVTVFFSWGNNRKVTISPEWRKRIDDFQGGAKSDDRRTGSDASGTGA